MQQYSKIVPTPDGWKVGPRLINGFQIITLQEFFSNPKIPHSVMEKPHRLEFDVVIVITNGIGKHVVDFIKYKYKPGSVFIIKNGQFHSWDINSDVEGFILFFTSDYYNRLIDNKHVIISNETREIVRPHINLSFNKDLQFISSILKLLKDQIDNIINNEDGFRLIIQAFIVEIERLYIKNFPSFRKPHKRSSINKLQELLDQEVLPSRNGTYYCDRLELTFKELNKVTKTMTGFTLKGYLDFWIITKAKKLLTNYDIPINGIANKLGFNEVGNFSKYFRKLTNTSPTAFRNSI